MKYAILPIPSQKIKWGQGWNYSLDYSVFDRRLLTNIRCSKCRRQDNKVALNGCVPVHVHPRAAMCRNKRNKECIFPGDFVKNELAKMDHFLFTKAKGRQKQPPSLLIRTDTNYWSDSLLKICLLIV